MYADDTVLFCEIDNASDKMLMTNQINKELDTFCQWCRANFLTVNTAKTKSMLFSAKSANSQIVNGGLQLRLNGEDLEFVNSYRYLGRGSGY